MLEVDLAQRVRGRRPAARAARSLSLRGVHAHRRPDDLPRVLRRGPVDEPARQGDPEAGRSTSACTSCATTPPTGIAPSTTPRTAAATGMVMKIEPLVTALEAITPPGARPDPAQRARPAASRSRTRTGSPRRRRWCWSAAATRASTSASRRYVDEQLCIGDYVLSGGEAAARGGHRRGVPPGPRRARQRGLARRGVVRQRPARVPAVHAARDLPRRARARRPAVRRPRRGRPLAPRRRRCATTAERRPDLLRCRSPATAPAPEPKKRQ